MLHHLHATCAHPPVHFKSSLQYLQYLMQYKCYTISCQCMENSNFDFWKFLELFFEYFQLMVGWIRGCGICGYGGLTVYIIHSVQLQFIPGMQGWSNMRKSTDIIHQLSRLKKKNHLIISVSTGSWKKQESSGKTSISALLTKPKPLTVWITINCGKFWKKWEYQTTGLPLEKSVCRSGSNS